MNKLSLKQIKYFITSILIAVPILLLFNGCSDNNSTNSGGLQSISIYAPTSLMHLNTTQQIIATGIYSNGSTQNITNLVTWQSSNSNAISVSNSANNQGVAIVGSSGSGNAIITASLNGISSNINITVSSLPLQSITILNPVLVAHVSVFVQLKALGIYSDGMQDITNNASWISESINIATISSGNNAGGLVNPIAAGNSIVTATFSNQSASLNLTVSSAAFISIAVTPNNSVTPLGVNQQLTATAVFADNLTQNVTQFVTWTSSLVNVATIISSGLAIPVNSGTTNITAQLNNISGSTNLTVTNATIQSIAINLSVSNRKNKLQAITATTHLGVSQQLTVIATFNDGTSQNVTSSAIWSSSNVSIASISNSTGTQGLVTPISVGTTVISANLLGQTALLNLIVSNAPLQSINITPNTASVALGIQKQFTALASFSDGIQNITNSAIWMSSNQSVAYVNNTGIASTIATGNTSISAKFNNITSTISNLNVSSATLSSLVVAPSTANLVAGQKQQFTANGVFTNGSVQNYSSSSGWTSSNANIITINSTGLATAISPGSATITATYAGISSTSTVTVNSSTFQSISITSNNPNQSYVQVGSTNQLNVVGTYSDGSQALITSGISWQSSNINFVTISNAGVATGIAIGSAIITATVNSLSATFALTVSLADNYVYVSNFNSNTISMYSINQTNGILVPLSPATVGSGVQPRGMAIVNTSSGRYLYVANTGSNTMQYYSISSTTGQLNSLGTIGAGTSPRQIAVVTISSGTYVYVTSGGATTLNVYSINQNTGVPTNIQTVSVQGEGISSLSTSLGTYIYTVTSTNSVAAYTVQSNGQLSLITTYAVGTAPAGVTSVTTATGNSYVYVSNQTGNSINQFSVTTSTGALTALNPASITPFTVTAYTSVANAAGTYLYSFGIGNAIDQFAIGSSGPLTQLSPPTISSGLNVTMGTISASGLYLYATNQNGNTVSMYGINQFTGVTGTLFPLPQSSIATGTVPFGIVSW